MPSRRLVVPLLFARCYACPPLGSFFSCGLDTGEQKCPVVRIPPDIVAQSAYVDCSASAADSRTRIDEVTALAAASTYGSAGFVFGAKHRRICFAANWRKPSTRVSGPLHRLSCWSDLR